MFSVDHGGGFNIPLTMTQAISACLTLFPIEMAGVCLDRLGVTYMTAMMTKLDAKVRFAQFDAPLGCGQ